MKLGAPGKIRTLDPIVTNNPLWPTELRGRLVAQLGVEPKSRGYEPQMLTTTLLRNTKIALLLNCVSLLITFN